MTRSEAYIVFPIYVYIHLKLSSVKKKGIFYFINYMMFIFIF